MMNIEHTSITVRDLVNSWLDKYNPEQFEIVGIANHGKDSEYDLFAPTIDGETIYKRILIRHKPATEEAEA